MRTQDDTAAGTANAGYVLERSDLRQMRNTYAHELFERYLPFLERFVLDQEFGGFCCHTTPSGVRRSDQKRTWFEGRGMWVYAYLYNNFGREQRHLDVALRSHDLLARSGPAAPNDLRPSLLHRDGSPAGPPDTEVYSDLFVAEGLAELARATDDDAMADVARATVMRCVAHYDSPAYAAQIGRTYLGAEAPPLAGARVLGVWMVLIRTVSQLLELRPDEELEALMQRCLDAVLDRHLNPRFQLLNELLSHDLSPAPPYDRLVYLGHAIETLWIVLSEARRRADVRLFERTAVSFRRHCEVAIDRVLRRPLPQHARCRPGHLHAGQDPLRPPGGADRRPVAGGGR